MLHTWIILVSLPFILAETHFTDEPGSCTIIGDVDIYGLGVRIGYYFQYTAALFSLAAKRREDLAGIRNGFNALNIALLINLFRSRSTTLPIEWYFVFLLTCMIPVSILRIQDPVSGIEDRNALPFFIYAELVQSLIHSMFLVSTPWLFFSGMGIGHKANCDVQIYLFTTISLYDTNLSTAGKVLSVVAFLSGSGYIIFVLLGLYNNELPSAGFPVPALPYLPIKKIVESTTYRLPNLKCTTSIKKQTWHLLVVAFAMGALSIFSIERTIAINNIDLSSGHITAAGQLIPMIAGIYAFLASVVRADTGILEMFLLALLYIVAMALYKPVKLSISASKGLWKFLGKKWPGQYATEA